MYLLFSHLHTFASAVLPLLPETHGPLLGGWSRALDNIQDPDGGTEGTVGHTMPPGEVKRVSWRW